MAFRKREDDAMRELRKASRIELLELLVEEMTQNEANAAAAEEASALAERLKAKLDEKDAQVQALTAKLDEKDEKAARLRGRIADGAEQVERLKVKLDDKDEQIARLIEKLDEKDAQLRSHAVESEDVIERLKAKLDVKDAQIARLSARLDEKDSRIAREREQMRIAAMAAGTVGLRDLQEVQARAVEAYLTQVADGAAATVLPSGLPRGNAMPMPVWADALNSQDACIAADADVL